MATVLPDIESPRSEQENACVEGASTADVLRLLGAGATGAILMALGEAPLRTKALTEQVPGYAPRTIYRYAGKLAELEVIDRLEEPGVPSKVVHRLSDPCGTELHELVGRFAEATLSRRPDGRIDAPSWASLGLLADLWEAGLVEELCCAPRSSTDLASGGGHGLSYHQVNRRTGLFRAGGLLRDWQGPGCNHCFELTEKTRRSMGLVTAVARWRGRHVARANEAGLTEKEMATVLRAALPLVELPAHRGKCLQLSVAGQEVWAEVEANGSVHSCGAPADPDSRALGQVEDWVAFLLDGESGALRVEGEEKPLADCLASLYGRLWIPSPF